MSISKIKTGSITTDAITEAKVADAAIENEHLNNNVVLGQTELSATAADDDILLIYDTSAGTLKKIQSSNVGITPPTFSSVSPTSLETGDLTGNYTIVVTGAKFDATATFKLRTTGGTDISMDSVTRNSSTQLTGTVAKTTANLTNANEPFDIIITNGNGLAVVSEDQINVDAQPVYVTSAGSLGSGTGGTSVSFSVNATDPESAGNVTFELQSGTLPPGLSLTNTAAEGGTAIISGTATDPAANTTYNFTLRAVDAASNTSSRAFSITINRALISESFTSSGTFSVPSGITAVDVMVVAGGGAGALQHGGGGGAGGLIFMPEYPVTPGGTVSVTVGCGGVAVVGPQASNHTQPVAARGQDSVFGTLTAKGGGYGGSYRSTSPYAASDGDSGGSGGGGGSNEHSTVSSGGTATQPTQPGNSGAYGFGNNGGQGNGPATGTPWYIGGGGGGAGATGGQGGPNSGNGGAGRFYTIADGTTPVGYGGGGGGGSHELTPSNPQGGGLGGPGGGGRGNSLDKDSPGPGQGGQPGTANRGGGGGGSSRTDYCGPSGQGGKGVVIVRY